MPLQDDVTAAQRCLDELVRSLGPLEERLGSGLEIRRVRTDAGHLRESLALLREAVPAAGPAAGRPDLVTISDAPYDTTLWSAAASSATGDYVDDEGIGARDRHAP
ncbi:hypothetical protein G3I19_11975 [Streptomyces sp. SID10853]|uniref:hypothetical protein n=1 Tax=Streptomyces sp. SID10853 TaxID=2706028 RepID=UPI0013C0AB20|nr:hypothetical protein [Streptomyces sp. SID10853]NDZ79219.1 hypothetical protein [Streptomyces sp. SID10853]